MTELLERAIAQLKTRTDDEQDAIAAIILAELEDDRRWDESFDCSPDLLAKLAAEAMTEYRAGKTEELDPETLRNPVKLPSFAKCLPICQSRFKSKPARPIGNYSKIQAIPVYGSRKSIPSCQSTLPVSTETTEQSGK